MSGAATGRDRGSVMPAFLALVLVTMVMGVLFFQVGRAADLGAQAQTGSDAAALVAADDIKDQIIQWIYTGAWNERPFVVDTLAAANAARDYADRNDGLVTAFGIRTVGYLSYEVDVEAVTKDTLTPAGYVSEDPETGERTTFTVGDGERGVQQATARVAPGAGSFLGVGGYFHPAGGGNASATSVSGGCSVPEAEVATVAAAAGIDYDPAASYVLERYDSCDGGVSVHALSDAMKISVMKLEATMGVPLNLASAYRSPAYQAQLCLRVTGPCAAPGASMHNYGLAIDVGNYQTAAAAVNADPSIGLCQPLPSNDAVHFSHVSGRECGGRTGTAGSGTFLAFGGVASLRSQVAIVVNLTR